MADNKILFILGAGPNVATATAKRFAAQGYQVALVSRGTFTSFDPSYFYIQGDLSNPEEIPEWFAQVKKKYGGAPNVVIHNAYHVFPAQPDNPLSLSLGQLNYDLTVNFTSAYLTAQEAVKGFESLPAEAPKSFIYTANGLNMMPMPRLVSLGLGKTALGHVIENATLAFAGKGYTFYYGDERLSNGDFASGAISGVAHAERYWELSQDRKQRPWMDTFVAGQGYKEFPKA
ncbi:short chain type dehydrogenase [Penicillium frequentans]|uniref:Short chain type dehydrogenase n=1 Tax=Penicillium frequentans TaxID=3151616 RepID=A0AAD6GDD1_9EURO|nr:short chain type dehydrogenase [Penicillium glabrum]